jgi:hypothetical protein
VPNPCGSGPCCKAPCGPGADVFAGAWVAELDANLLFWWTKSGRVPPLATTSAPADLGILGAPTTSVVLGDRSATFDPPRLGGQFAGRFFIQEGWGVGVGGFFLENGAERRSAAGFPVLALPTIDPDTLTNSAIRLAAPGAAVGSAELEMGSRLWGIETNIIYRIDDARDWQVDGFFGFRFLSLAETLKLRTNTTVFDEGLFNGLVTPPGSTFAGLDSFGTRNSFYGGQVGGRVRAQVAEYLVLQATAQIALGATQSRVGIDGATMLSTNVPGQGLAFAPGNAYTQVTNIGRTTRDRTTFVPQVTLSVGYQVTEFAAILIGYDFLYWNSVARPGDQIDRAVNPTFPPILNDGTVAGALRPERRLEHTDFWAQGVSVGFQLRY